MRNTLFSFLFFTPYLLFAQIKHVVIGGKVTDILNKPISYVNIQNTSTQEGTITDISGHYSFNTTLPATLKALLIGYKTVVKKIELETGKDTIRVDFVLEVDSTQLQQIEVTATHVPEMIKESGSLIDFDIIDRNLWILFDYGKKDNLQVFDAGLNYLNRMVLKYHSKAIYKTPHNIFYLMSEDSIHLLAYKQQEKTFTSSSMSIEKFNLFVNVNLKGYNYPNYYYLWTSTDSSAINYRYFNSAIKENKKLYYYKNSILSRQNNNILFELYLSHSILYPTDLDNITPEKTEIIPSLMSGNSEDVMAANAAMEERLISKSLFMSIFCPLRIVRDSIYIFNFDNDSIYIYNLNNSRIRQMPLSFSVHGIKYKNQDILVNEEATECYFKFVVNGTAYLQKIDLNTGKKINTQKLGFLFPEKIRIWSGYAYYTYSNTGDNQMFIRHLYRQKIN